MVGQPDRLALDAVVLDACLVDAALPDALAAYGRARVVLAAELGLDHGYLSRILRGFNERGLITKTPSPDDRRQSFLSLTAKGRMAFAPLDAAFAPSGECR